MRYLIIADAAQVEAAAAIVGKNYEVVSLELAKNGHLAEISGNPCVLWPDADTVATAKAWGTELAAFGEVKLINPRLGFLPTPAEMKDQDWTYKDFINWVTGKADSSTNLVEVLEFMQEEDKLGNIPINAADDAAPIASPPGSSPAAPSLAAIPFSPDGGAPDEVPLEAYYEASEPLSADEAYSPYVSTETAQGAAEWPEQPSDWWSEGRVPELAIDLAPPCFRSYIEREAETMGVDRGIFALYMLGFCAGALSDSHVLQVKPDNPRWVQPARLWLMMIGNSSTKKTPPLTELRGAAWKLELEMRQRSMADEERWIEETKIYEKQLDAYISAKAKGESREAPQKPQPPNRERMLVGNATVEALSDILLHNERGVLNIMDELASVLKGLGQYKAGGNDKEAYLMGFDGGPYPIDRKGRAELIPNFGWSFIGGTQKQKIRDVSASLRLESDGFMARFLPYVARNATEDLDRPADHAGYQHFTDILHRLRDMQSHAPIRFSADAQAIRREFSSWAWNQAKGEWLGDSLRSAISKYDTQYARMCLVYHAIECADNHNAVLEAEVSAKTAHIVARLFKECLYWHAENVYLHILDASSDIMQHVRKIAGKILAKGWQEVTPTTLAQGWTGWRKLAAWQRRAVLGILCEGGWLKSADRRGYVEGVTITYQAHPRLRQIFPHHTEMEIAYLEDMAQRRTDRIVGED